MNPTPAAGRLAIQAVAGQLGAFGNRTRTDGVTEPMASTTHLYNHVAEYLTERIRKGIIPANSRIPSERVLAEQFGVSRVTVRQALKELESAGLVETDGG